MLTGVATRNCWILAKGRRGGGGRAAGHERAGVRPLTRRECGGCQESYGGPMDVSQHQPPGGAAAPEPEAMEQRPLYVPVRRGPAGTVLRLWRTPVGTRTAVAFTSDRRLRSVLGPCQPWIRLSEAALRGMAEPLGTTRLTVDPVLTARPPASWPDTAAGGPCVPHDEPRPTAARAR